MRRLLFALALLALLLPAGAAHADGVIIDPPCPLGSPLPCTPPPPPPCDFYPCPPLRRLFPLAIQYHRVTVAIENQVATTHVDQLFRNDNSSTVEGTYIFPIPTDAAVNDFAMWVDGQKVAGKVLSKDEARRVYNDIVRQVKDPALLEYMGLGAVQASVFPIPSGDTRRIELEYSQVLRADGGLIHYRYPLNTEKFSALPLEQVSIAVKVASPDPVRAIYSPSHPVSVARDGDNRFSVGYEANNVTPDTDFDLYYSVSPKDIGLNLLTYRDPATGEGFFLLLAAPSLNVDAAKVVARDVIVVLDQSGSMDGEKFRQAQSALKYVLNHLNAEDRFNIVAFSTGVTPFADRLQPALSASEAARWVDSLVAQGGTNIDLALLTAMGLANQERPAILIFLTDGLATEGVTGTEQILADVQRAAPGNVRLFDFGVGDDVDTILLDTLAEQNHGASAYVRPGQDIDEAVSGFYARVSTPVLSDVKLDFGGAEAFDLYPNPLPDLFAGSQLVLAGRYQNPGPGAVSLAGTVNGRPQSFRYGDQFFSRSGGGEFIPRLWATRKIGYLLNQIRLHGENQEVIDQIVKLSIRYGIITPYTSYLVTEPGSTVLTDAGRTGLAADEYAKAAAATAAPASGGGAVDAAQDQSALAAAEAPAAPPAEAANIVKLVGNRTFLYADGVWIDTGFDPSRMTTTKVEFAGDDYFALIAARPELAGGFALGPNVIALAADGAAYEAISSAAPALDLPPTYTPAPEATRAADANPSSTLTPGGSTPAPTGSACPGAFLALGLVAAPFVLKRRHA